MANQNDLMRRLCKPALCKSDHYRRQHSRQDLSGVSEDLRKWQKSFFKDCSRLNWPVLFWFVQDADDPSEFGQSVAVGLYGHAPVLDEEWAALEALANENSLKTNVKVRTEVRGDHHFWRLAP